MQSNGAIIRRPDTGCSVTLGPGLEPVGMRHTQKCMCITIDAPEQFDQIVSSAENAVSMRILDSEKPSLALAMLLLGAVHVLK